MSLLDDQPLDLKEQRAIATATTSSAAKEWWAGLPDNTRRAVIQKTLAALATATEPRDIGTLTRSLIMMDKLDFEREQGAKPGATHNTQINIYGTPAATKALQSEDGRNALSRLRDVIKGGDAAPPSEA